MPSPAAPAGGEAVSAGSAPVAALRLQDIRKSFGRRLVIDGVTLDVAEGELLAILGPSGCGKSTLLRVVAGLERQDGGRVTLGGVDAGGLPPAARRCGVVFQSYALFPTLTAAANVAFGIDRRRCGRRQRAQRARELLEQVGLADAADQYPAQLSGGQQQRVALARALATQPALLLLDEPLSALDAKVRAKLRAEIRQLQQQARLTALLVTHDQEEALTMADRVAVMRAGRLVQVGTPREVYQRPADELVAAFVGAMNLLHGWTAGPRGTLARYGVTLRTADGPPAAAGAVMTVGFRPEEASISLDPPPPILPNVFACRLERVEFRGAFVRHYLSPCEGRPGEQVVVDGTAHESASLDARPQQVVYVTVRPEGVRVFPGAAVSQ